MDLGLMMGRSICSNVKSRTGSIAYAIELIEEKWYVGLAGNFAERYGSHQTDRQTRWVEKYEVKENGSFELREIPIIKGDKDRNNTVHVFENEMTIEYMKKYGVDNVRGGYWTSPNLCKDNLFKNHPELYEGGTLERYMVG